MKKRFKQYFEWLFAGNVLTFDAKTSQNKLVFEGHTKALSTLLINSFGSLAVMTFPAILIILKVDHPLLILLFVLLMLAGFIAFGIGMIAMAYQPFWQHRKQLTISPEGIFSKNGAGFPINTKVRRIKQFKVRFEVVNPQTTHVQFWLNGNKRYFINAFFQGLPRDNAQIFDWFRTYALQWGLQAYDISPSKDENIEVFEFTQQGKNQLNPRASFAQLQQQALENQLKVSNAPEIIAKYAFRKEKDEVFVQRRPGFKRRSWLFFLSSFFGGLGLLVLLISLAASDKGDNQAGMYVFIACIAFLWGIFSLVSFNDIRSDFLIRTNSQQLYFQSRKNNGIALNKDNIECILIQGKIHQSRYTTLNGVILVQLKEAVSFKNNPTQALQLLIVDSGRPEKLDTQLVRDAVYERSMRVARLIAQPLGIEVVWKGFEK